MAMRRLFRYASVSGRPNSRKRDMNHKTFTMTVILTTFAAAMWFGYLFVSDRIGGGKFFLYMAATIPALLLFRTLYSLILRNRRP
jgi:hypothetical protein